MAGAFCICCTVKSSAAVVSEKLEFDPGSLGKNGFVCEFAFKYAFLMCGGEVTVVPVLNFKEKSDTYVYEGRRYSVSATGYVGKEGRRFEANGVEAELYFNGSSLGMVRLEYITNIVTDAIGGCLSDTYAPLKMLGLDSKNYSEQIDGFSLRNISIIAGDSRDPSFEEHLKNDEPADNSSSVPSSADATFPGRERGTLTYDHVVNNIPGGLTIHEGYDEQGRRVRFTAAQREKFVRGQRYTIEGEVNPDGIIAVHSISIASSTGLTENSPSGNEVNSDYVSSNDVDARTADSASAAAASSNDNVRGQTAMIQQADRETRIRNEGIQEMEGVAARALGAGMGYGIMLCEDIKGLMVSTPSDGSLLMLIGYGMNDLLSSPEDDVDSGETFRKKWMLSFDFGINAFKTRRILPCIGAVMGGWREKRKTDSFAEDVKDESFLLGISFGFSVILEPFQGYIGWNTLFSDGVNIGIMLNFGQD